jgi:hypothetical protein
MAGGGNKFGNAGYPAVLCTADAAFFLQKKLDMNMINLSQQHGRMQKRNSST